MSDVDNYVPERKRYIVSIFNINRVTSVMPENDGVKKIEPDPLLYCNSTFGDTDKSDKDKVVIIPDSRRICKEGDIVIITIIDIQTDDNGAFQFGKLGVVELGPVMPMEEWQDVKDKLFKRPDHFKESDTTVY